MPSNKNPHPDDGRDRVALPLDPEEALRALLQVKPDDPPVDDEEAPAD